MEKILSEGWEGEKYVIRSTGIYGGDATQELFWGDAFCLKCKTKVGDEKTHPSVCGWGGYEDDETMEEREDRSFSCLDSLGWEDEKSGDEMRRDRSERGSSSGLRTT